MKLLSVEQARSIWLFPTADVNPTGKFIGPIFADLIKIYKFGSVPNLPEAIKKNAGVQFSVGMFNSPKHGPINADVGIFNDGLIGDTRTDTDTTDEFLDDILTRGKKEMGLEYPANIRKQYASKVHVEVSKSLNSLNSKLEMFAKHISEKSPGFSNATYQLGGINFVAEQVGPLASQVFRFEKVENVPFSTNRYYSFAAMRTTDHLELLAQLEAILR